MRSTLKVRTVRCHLLLQRHSFNSDRALPCHRAEMSRPTAAVKGCIDSCLRSFSIRGGAGTSTVRRSSSSIASRPKRESQILSSTRSAFSTSSSSRADQPRRSQAGVKGTASITGATSAGGPQDPLAYCSSLVQRLDPEAYLTSYFWGKRERAWFLAWRAFNVGPNYTPCFYPTSISLII